MNASFAAWELQSPALTSSRRADIFDAIWKVLGADVNKRADEVQIQIQRYQNLVPYISYGLLDMIMAFLSEESNYPIDVTTEDGEEVRSPYFFLKWHVVF